MERKLAVEMVLVAAIILISTTILFSQSSFFVFASCTNWAGELDNDCDGLADDWETNGYDVNDDGTVDLTFPGANPDRADIYVELDYMKTGNSDHKPRTGVVEAVVDAFNAAPVSNPGGQPDGINLHVLVNEPIPHVNSITMWSGFDTLKDTWFGENSVERSKPFTMQAKDNTYHYVLFIHQYNGGSSSGLAELPGDDLVVSLGAPGWGTFNGHTVGSVDQQQGTLMHELGHNLNLRHGGNVDENCKPNYLSVMSYSLQFSNYDSSRLLDYSRSLLNLLNENALIEQNGISPASEPVGRKAVYGPSPPLTSQPLSLPLNPINWDRDSNPSETVSRNINNLGSSSGCTSTLLSNIAGFDDWLNLVYWGTGSGWGDGSMAGSNGNAKNTSSDKDSVFGKTKSINATNLENGLNTTDPPYRPGLDELNVDNVLASRILLLESIINNVESLPAKDLKNKNSKEMLKNNLITIQDKFNSRTTDILPIINSLIEIRKQMDSSAGGNSSDDLVVNRNTQKSLLAGIDNLIEALIKQR